MRSRTKSIALAGAFGVVLACNTSGGAGSGTIRVTASGEALGQDGFPFPPGSTEDPYFVDGWSVSLDALLVTIDRVVVSEGPDTSPTDQSQTGRQVAHMNGSFAIDLHKPGTEAGKEDGTTAFFLGTIDRQNDNGGASFESDTKYAFGFDLATATPDANRINFDSTDESDYQEMIANGYSVLYVGTATFTGTSCTPTLGANATLDALPKVVHFRFGFTTRPRFVNCQNPDLGELANGDNPRGVPIKANSATTAQITIHADHPFWDARQEDSALRFDALALVAEQLKTDAITLEDLRGIPFLPINVNGVTLPSRTCMPAPPPTGMSQFYDPKGATFRDLYAYMSDRQSSQGHLDADGLCYVAPQ